MADERPNPQGEEPRSEPEIIPPGRAPRATWRVRIDTDTERVYGAKVRPLSTILVVLIVGLLSALMLVLLLGALLVWLPLVVLFVTRRWSIACLFSAWTLSLMPAARRVAGFAEGDVGRELPFRVTRRWPKAIEKPANIDPRCEPFHIRFAARILNSRHVPLADSVKEAHGLPHSAQRASCYVKADPMPDAHREGSCKMQSPQKPRQRFQPPLASNAAVLFNSHDERAFGPSTLTPVLREDQMPIKPFRPPTGRISPCCGLHLSTMLLNRPLASAA
jgi:hypothetical protein